MNEHNLANIAPTQMSWIWSLKSSTNISSFKFHLLLEENQLLVQEPVSSKVLWAFNVVYVKKKFWVIKCGNSKA